MISHGGAAYARKTMKINFQVIGVQELVDIAGSLTYVELVALAREHGIEATEVYSQLFDAVTKGKVKPWQSLGKPTLYQKVMTFGKMVSKLDDSEVEHVRQFLVDQYSDRQFRPGTVSKAMNEADKRRYEGEEEVSWDKEHVSVALKALVKKGVVIAGVPGPQGTWYKLVGMKKSK